MQTEQTANELIIRDSPGCLWIFAVFFISVGGIFVYGSLGGFINYRDQALWMLVLSFLMGAVAVAAGFWIISLAPVTRIVIDRVAEALIFKRYGLFEKIEETFSFEEIEGFCLIEDEDDESNPVWSLGMELSGGETIRISALASHDERFKRDFVHQANEFMRKQMPFVETVFELEDESGEKIS